MAILSDISEENVEHAKVRVSRKVCVQELFTCNAQQVLVEVGGVIEWAHVVLCSDQYEGGIRDWFQEVRLLLELWWSGRG